MRFKKDVICPRERTARITRDFNGPTALEIPDDGDYTTPTPKIRRFAHSVLTEDFVDDPEHPSYRGWATLLAFLREHLGVEGGSADMGKCKPNEESTVHDLGVLFVHGIGDQARGSTLLQGAHALVRWLERWFASPGAKPVKVVQPYQRATEVAGEEYAPANVLLDVTATGTSQKWLVAESWWQQDVVNPSFGAVAAWSIPMVPWLATEFFLGLRESLRSRNRLAALWAALLLFFSPLIGVLLMVGILLLWIVHSIPILGSRFRAIALGLARGAGDTFILGDPIQKAALWQRISKDLDWLEERCQTVAVVAHSQGAALSHELLFCYSKDSSNGPPPNRPMRHGKVKALITYGSGVWRLSALKDIRTDTKRLKIAGGLGLAGALLLGVSAWIFGGRLLALWLSLLLDWSRVGDAFRAFGFSVHYFWPFSAWLILGWVAHLVRTWNVERNLSERFQFKPEAGIRWSDYYGSADPVRIGPAIPATKEEVGLERYERIFNRRAVSTDHTTYFDNTDQFMTFLAFDLMDVAGLPWTPVGATSGSRDEVITRVGVNRAVRTGFLLLSRLLTIGVGVWVVSGLAGDLNTRAEGCVGRPLLCDIGSRLASAAEKVLPDWTRLTLPGWTIEPPEVFAVAAVLVLVFVAVALIGGVWTAWDRLALKELRDPASLNLRKGLLAVVFAFGAGAIISMLGVLGTAREISLALLGHWVLCMAVIGVFLLVGSPLFATPWRRPQGPFYDSPPTEPQTITASA
jgi:hypothetical protein